MTNPKTHFASAERDDKESVINQSKKINELTFTRKVLDAIPNMVLVLNEHRQVIYANDVFLNLIGSKDIEEALGQRPGELIKCLHAFENDYGCGTAYDCKYCGAVLSILESQETKKKIEKDARITVKKNDKLVPFDLRVIANPFDVNEEHFTLVILIDNSNLKKKEQLERTFIHDMINTTWALKSRTEIFPVENLNENQMKLFLKIKSEAEKIMSEIEAQRDILRMERGELETKFTTANSLKLIQESIDTVEALEISKNKEIKIENDSVEINIKTDARLLRRVLINLLKNAVEAGTEKETITISCKERTGELEFRIKNKTVMPDAVQSQIFQRSFSTKGKGRGLGTYSVKIIVEEYLKGEVYFTSSENEGTTFFVKLKI